MSTKIRTTRRRAAVIPAVLALGATLTLTSCIGGGGADPDEVFKEYVAALNDGDVEGALELLADPGDRTPENTEWVEELATEFPEPKLRSNLELDDEVESTSVAFDFVTEKPYQVSFTKVDGDWKIENPLFILERQVEGDSEAEDEPEEVVAEEEETNYADRYETSSSSTLLEVIDALDITATLPSGEEFDFPDYLAGIGVFEDTEPTNDFFEDAVGSSMQEGEITLSDLPDWEYLQQTPFEGAMLSIGTKIYAIKAQLAEPPLKSEYLDQATDFVTEATKGLTRTYEDSLYMFSSSTEYIQEMGEVLDCEGNMELPELNLTEDFAVLVDCRVSYTDSQYPGEERENTVTVFFRPTTEDFAMRSLNNFSDWS